jgi:hypothetical protein
MKHKGIEFLILARPGRDQWTYVISYPGSTDPSRTQFEGSRDQAITVARARIDNWLKRRAKTRRSCTEHGLPEEVASLALAVTAIED